MIIVGTRTEIETGFVGDTRVGVDSERSGAIGGPRTWRSSSSRIVGSRGDGGIRVGRHLRDCRRGN